MIISEKKPIEELMLMLGDAKKIALVGCASCATACGITFSSLRCSQCPFSQLSPELQRHLLLYTSAFL